METFKVDCPKCKGYVVIPILSADERAYVAGELRKSKSKVHWVRFLREQTGLDIFDTMRFLDHFNFELGRCAHCKLGSYDHSINLEYVICPRCKGVNLDWKGAAEIFPYVQPESISYMWDGRESGWVIAKQIVGDGDSYVFVNSETTTMLIIEAEHDKYNELLTIARQHGVPEVDFKEIFQ